MLPLQAPKLTRKQEQAILLEQACERVDAAGADMRRAADNDALKEVLRHASAMLAELKTSDIEPKAYMNLCMCFCGHPECRGLASALALPSHGIPTDLRVFDHLMFLGFFFDSLVSRGTSATELYDMVQRAGAALTRLYLMITVGSVLARTGGKPAAEVLFDLLAMSKGVQDPTRGLFLRYYMVQRFADIATNASTHPCSAGSAVDWALSNTVVMLKLWVRLQFTHDAKNKKRREKERRDLRTIVGTALQVLSSAAGITFSIFKDTVLPELLAQAIACNDKLAASFLMDSIMHIFPSKWVIACLLPCAKTAVALADVVDAPRLLAAMIDRLHSCGTTAPSSSAADPAEHEVMGAVASWKKQLAKLPPSAPGTEEPTTEEAPTAEHWLKVLSHRWKLLASAAPALAWQVEELGAQARASAALLDPSAVLMCFGATLQVLCKHYDTAQAAGGLLSATQSLLQLRLDCFEPSAAVLGEVLSVVAPVAHAHAADVDVQRGVEHVYGALRDNVDAVHVLHATDLRALSASADLSVQQAIARGLVSSMLGASLAIGQTRAAAPLKALESAEDAQAALNIAAPLLQAPPGASEPVALDVEAVARLVHLLPVQDLPAADSFTVLFELRQRFTDAGSLVCRLALPAIVAVGCQLLRRLFADAREVEELAAEVPAGSAAAPRPTGRMGKAAFKLVSFLSETCKAIAAITPEIAVACCAQAGIAGAAGGMGYDLLADGFLAYEEVADSKARVTALRCLMQAVQQALYAGLGEDEYLGLAKQATTHAAHLLRKPDSARAVCSAATMFWLPEQNGRHLCLPEQVLQCLQRSLKTAAQIVPKDCGLFVEVAEVYTRFFQAGIETLTAADVSATLTIASETLAEASSSAAKTAAATHYASLCAHIQALASGDDPAAEQFSDIVLPA